MIPALALGLGGCNKPEEAKAPETPPTAVAETPKPAETPAAIPPPAVPQVPKAGVAERAAKLGFAQHLPQDTEVVFAMYNGTNIADRVKTSRFWKLMQDQMGLGGMGLDGAEVELPEPDAVAPDPVKPDEATEPAAPVDPADPGAPADPAAPAEDEVGPAALFGTEFTMALGKPAAQQGANLLTVNRRMTYFQMRNIVKAFSAAVKSGDASSLEESMASSYSDELAKDLFNDPQSGVALLEKVQMPPMYFAFRIAEARRPAAALQIASFIGEMSGMAEEMTEPVTLDVAGSTFTGTKILGAKLAQTMTESRESMDEEIGAPTVDRLLAAVAKKDIVVVSGVVGDYVLLFFGNSVDDLKLVTDPKQSIVGTDALAFTDGYLDKDLATVMYGQKEAMDTLIGSMPGIADMTNGLRDGIAGSDGLGDTRDLEALFQIVADREAALRKLSHTDATGSVAFFEEGLKIESFGGTDNGMFAWETPNHLGKLGDSEDVVLFADMTTNPAYTEKSRAYVEALMETGYAMAMKVSASAPDTGDMAQYKEMAKTFDEKFRPDMIALWDSLSKDFSGGIGQERAIVVDLKGGAPAVPKIPQKVLDNAKIPRISIIFPVTDRAKVSGSWDKMNGTLTGTFAKISEIAGEDYPMQKPMSSERNGNVTWFFPMPFLTDDFVPSVTLNDKWFAASTSKNQALDLMAKAETPSETTTQGVWFTMNFKALQKYADEMVKLADENAEEATGAALGEPEKKGMKDALSLLDNMDKLTVHTRREASGMRSSIHFKTR